PLEQAFQQYADLAAGRDAEHAYHVLAVDGQVRDLHGGVLARDGVDAAAKLPDLVVRILAEAAPRDVPAAQREQRPQRLGAADVADEAPDRAVGPVGRVIEHVVLDHPHHALAVGVRELEAAADGVRHLRADVLVLEEAELPREALAGLAGARLAYV